MTQAAARATKPTTPGEAWIPPRILRPRSASIYSGLSKSYLDKLRVRGGGPRFVRLGARMVGYDVRDLDTWLEERKRSSTSDNGAAR
jgi:predicted DNA-binding transcriptional regulator AlpA